MLICGASLIQTPIRRKKISIGVLILGIKLHARTYYCGKKSVLSSISVEGFHCTAIQFAQTLCVKHLVRKLENVYKHPSTCMERIYGTLCQPTKCRRAAHEQNSSADGPAPYATYTLGTFPGGTNESHSWIAVKERLGVLEHHCITVIHDHIVVPVAHQSK